MFAQYNLIKIPDFKLVARIKVGAQNSWLIDVAVTVVVILDLKSFIFIITDLKGGFTRWIKG